MTTNGRAFICTIIFFMLGVIMICAAAHQANAERAWPNSEFSRDVVVIKAKPRRHIKRVRKRTYKTKRRPRVKAWRVVKPTRVSGCKPTISVVGDQAPSEKGAKAQAQKAWSQEARYRVGERHADLRFARDVLYSCVRSSIPNLATRQTDKIGLNSQLKRCSISAQPCIAPVSR